MNSLKTLPWLLAASALVLGCGSDPKPPPAAPAPPPGPTETRGDEAAEGDQGPVDPSPVNVDQRIVEMCELHTSHFDFDSANIPPSARKVLDAIAACFIDGAGKGRRLNLVGHADPRGETEYNFALGQRRAGAVEQYLIGAGVADPRMDSLSRGELEASGTDERSWADDRRVEILLAD